jgi:hypothetical protein
LHGEETLASPMRTNVRVERELPAPSQGWVKPSSYYIRAYQADPSYSIVGLTLAVNLGSGAGNFSPEVGANGWGRLVVCVALVPRVSAFLLLLGRHSASEARLMGVEYSRVDPCGMWDN